MVSPAQAYFLHRRRKKKPEEQVSSTDLADITADINAIGKREFKLVMDLDTLTAYAALGPAADDAWRPVGVFDDSGDVTPA